MNDKITQKQDRVTIKTVAADSGVSVAAVSKVLRNAYGVSESLRQNVLQSIEKLGYRPNMAARGMRGRTHTIGVLMVELRNPFLPQVIDGVNRVLAPSHYHAMIGIGQNDLPLEASLIESMIDYKMDGLILIAPRLQLDALTRFAAEIPIVLIGYHQSAATTFDTINTDDFAGGELATTTLIGRGFRDILMVSLELTGDAETGVILPRERGYAHAMRAAGLAHLIRVCHVRNNADKLARIEAILTAPDRPEAIFCWSDLDAVHVLGVAARLGVRVPTDISVVGYDNTSVAAMPLVDLTCVSQSGGDLGALAAQTLMDRIEGRTDPIHVLLAPSMVYRHSLGTPPVRQTAAGAAARRSGKRPTG